MKKAFVQTREKGDKTGMNIAFIQDCADETVVTRQRAAIAEYARSRNIAINGWVNAAQFFPEALNSGDVLLVEKTFRLAKDVRSIALLLEKLLSNGVEICSCEDGLRFGGIGKASAEMASLFGMVAKIAEELRSQLTKEGLENAQAAGQVLGRPRGRQNKRLKLTGRADEIANLLRQGCSRNRISRLLHVNPRTLNSFIQKVFPNKSKKNDCF